MAINTVDQKSYQPLPLRRWFLLVLTYLFVPAILFVCGWDLGCWQALVSGKLRREYGFTDVDGTQPVWLY